MRKLLSLALVGVGARLLLDADRRAALIGRLRGARDGVAPGTESTGDTAGALAGSVGSRAAEGDPDGVESLLHLPGEPAPMHE